MSYFCWHGTWSFFPWSQSKDEFTARFVPSMTLGGQGVLGPAASIMLPNVQNPRLYATWVFLKISKNNRRSEPWYAWWVHESLLCFCFVCCACTFLCLLYLRVVGCSFLLLLFLPDDKLQQQGELPRFVIALLDYRLLFLLFALPLRLVELLT